MLLFIQIAILLLGAYPNTTPLRVQPTPSEAELQEWRRNFARVAHNTVGLTAPFTAKGHRCNCALECTCVSQAHQATAPPLDFITVKQDLWDQVSITREY